MKWVAQRAMVLEYRFLDKPSDVGAERRLPLELTRAKKRPESAAPANHESQHV